MKQFIYAFRDLHWTINKMFNVLIQWVESQFFPIKPMAQIEHVCFISFTVFQLMASALLFTSWNALTGLFSANRQSVCLFSRTGQVSTLEVPGQPQVWLHCHPAQGQRLMEVS